MINLWIIYASYLIITSLDGYNVSHVHLTVSGQIDSYYQQGIVLQARLLNVVRHNAYAFNHKTVMADVQNWVESHYYLKGYEKWKKFYDLALRQGW